MAHCIYILIELASKNTILKDSILKMKTLITLRLHSDKGLQRKGKHIFTKFGITVLILYIHFLLLRDMSIFFDLRVTFLFYGINIGFSSSVLIFEIESALFFERLLRFALC